MDDFNRFNIVLNQMGFMPLEFWVKGKIQDKIYVDFALSQGCSHLHLPYMIPFSLSTLLK